MPLPIAALAGLAAIPGAAQAGLGIYQTIQANKYRKEFKRPTFETPPSIGKATELAKREALKTKLPGQDLIEQKLASKTAQGVSALKEAADSPVGVQAGVTRLVEGEQRALAGLKIGAEQMRSRQVLNLQRALGVEAGYELEAFKMNEFEPYMNAQRTAAMMGSAGTQNIFAGAGSAVSGAIGIAGQGEMMQYLEGTTSPYEQFMMNYRNQNYGSPAMQQIASRKPPLSIN